MSNSVWTVYMPYSLYWCVLYLTQFPFVPDWPYYEVKLVFIILREDRNKTNIYDAREVAAQWVRKKNAYWIFTVRTRQNINNICILSSLQVYTSNKRIKFGADIRTFAQSQSVSFRRVRYCNISLNTVQMFSGQNPNLLLLSFHSLYPDSSRNAKVRL